MTMTSHPSARSTYERFTVVPAHRTEGLERDGSPRYQFRVPSHWRAPVSRSPYALEAEQAVLAWLASLGCSRSEVERAAKFDAAGYVGIPFPALTRDKTVRLGKYLSLWLLWDDVHVESLENRWRIDADHVLSGRRPEGMTRFDEGWWQLLQELAVDRSPDWIQSLCEAMATWNVAAMAEAEAVRRYRERGVLPRFDEQLELRIATIGMYGTLLLLEDAHGMELPHAFHAHPTVQRLAWLSNEIVGVGNDILSYGKDHTEDQINLLSTLMRERGLRGEDALDQLLRMHDDALEEFDRLAPSLESCAPETGVDLARWLQDVRYASLGFSLWEAQAPRYSAYKMVAGGKVLEPRFTFHSPRPARAPGAL